MNLRAFCAKYGEGCSALTITFPVNVTNAERAIRFNSLSTNYLRPRYGAAIVVAEFHENGRIHFHAITGRLKGESNQAIDWQGEAKLWRRTAVRYGCGRVTFNKVRDSEAYCKYLLKDLNKPTPHGERLRRIRYVGASCRRQVNKETGEITAGKTPAFIRPYSDTYSWANGRAKEWRKQAQAFATTLHQRGEITEPTPKGLTAKFSRNWFLVCAKEIERFTTAENYEPMTYSELRAAMAKSRRNSMKERAVKVPKLTVVWSVTAIKPSGDRSPPPASDRSGSGMAVAA